MAKLSTAASCDDSASSASPVSTSRPDPHPISAKPTSQSKAAGHPVSTAAAQFHRFRLTEFNRTDNSSPTTSSAPAGQCSRFRVSDFVPSPWGNTSDTPSHTPTTPVAMSPVNGMVNGGRPASANGAGGSPSGAAARQGSFSVMHMDVEGSGPQQTSTSVAAAAGSGRGVLQKIAVSPQQPQVIVTKSGTNTQQRPLAPSPISAGGAKPFDPSTVPQEAVWELSRVLTIFRQLPAEAIVKQITDVLMQWPTLADGSLLRRIGEVFPSLPPTNQNGNTAGQSLEQPRKKRGRPPGKKAKLNDGTSAPVPIAASPVGPQAMAPPPLPYAQAQPVLAPAPVPPPGPPLTARGKNAADKLVQCTRCLKDFNPTWRATPASDPSSEATCAVKHQFKTFEQGLEAVTLPRRKNNYKTTWKWKCCGREVQSTSDQLLMWPRKEDDRTGGWCFVGKHTTEPGVREKLGLKPGKGKKISEEIGKKRKKILETKETLAPGQANGNTMGAITQSQDVEAAKGNWVLPENADLSEVADGNLDYGLAQQQQSPPSAYPQTDSAPQSDDPPKRKRGRPKGSKTRNKAMQMTVPGSSTPKEQNVAPVPAIGVGVLQQNAGPEQQLMNEVQQQQHDHLQTTQAHDPVIGVGVVHDQNSFWTQYTEPNLDLEEQDPDDDNDDGGGDDGEGDDDDGSQDREENSEDPAISTADLSLLASATAAMSTSQTQQQLVEDAPEKRKRGRPKGSRNGKMPVETTQKALRMKPATNAITSGDLAAAKANAAAVTKSIPPPPPPPLQPDPAVAGTDEGAPFVGMAGIGAMDGYGELGSGDGGGWFS